MNLLSKITERYRQLTFKSMNGWLTDREKKFLDATRKLFYGRWGRYPDAPSNTSLKRHAKRFDVV